MFTRDELTSKSLQELQELGNSLGINPIGNPNIPASWIVPLLSVGRLAMNDCDRAIGMRRFPDARIAIQIEAALDMLGQATPAQKAIIKGALRGHWMGRLDERAVQQRLLEIWIARTNLLEALAILK